MHYSEKILKKFEKCFGFIIQSVRPNNVKLNEKQITFIEYTGKLSLLFFKFSVMFS